MPSDKPATGEGMTADLDRCPRCKLMGNPHRRPVSCAIALRKALDAYQGAANELVAVLREKWALEVPRDALTFFLSAVIAGIAKEWAANPPANGITHSMNWPEIGTLQIELRKIDGASAAQSLTRLQAELDCLRAENLRLAAVIKESADALNDEDNACEGQLFQECTRVSDVHFELEKALAGSTAALEAYAAGKVGEAINAQRDIECDGCNQMVFSVGLILDNRLALNLCAPCAAMKLAAVAKRKDAELEAQSRALNAVIAAAEKLRAWAWSLSMHIDKRSQKAECETDIAAFDAAVGKGE